MTTPLEAFLQRDMERANEKAAPRDYGRAVSRREMQTRFESLVKERTGCRCERPILDGSYSDARLCRRCGWLRRERA